MNEAVVSPACTFPTRQQGSSVHPGLVATQVLLGLLLSTPPLFAAPAFHRLGLGPGGISSDATAMTPDGEIVVGQASSLSGGGFEAYRWTAQGGFEMLGFLPDRDIESKALGISPDGGVVVGYSRANVEGVSQRRQAFVWRRGSGMVKLPQLSDTFEDSAAFGTAAGGIKIVGYSTDENGRHQPVYWSFVGAEWQLTVLSDSNPDWLGGEARAVNPDGTQIAGFRELYVFGFPPSTYSRGFRWATGQGFTVLEPLENDLHSWGYAISSGGEWVVGQSLGSPVRWNTAGQVQSLGSLSLIPPFDRYETFAITPAGDQIAGTTEATEPDNRGFLWDAGQGIRSVKVLLENAGVADLDDWWLAHITGISADGTILAGYGANPNFRNEAFVINLAGHAAGGPVLTSGPATGGQVSFKWITIPGFEYWIEGRENVNTGEWMQVGDRFTGDGSIHEFIADAATGQQFFQLVKQALP